MGVELMTPEQRAEVVMDLSREVLAVFEKHDAKPSTVMTTLAIVAVEVYQSKFPHISEEKFMAAHHASVWNAIRAMELTRKGRH
jgi:hypothetical protein